jgi:chromosome segregation protein
MPSHLKALELHGYKTFASRTLFLFAESVTAIVGPNGSGKSNIADSLRWVLGEQSYSLLRGKKTEDMIFSGSEFRTRAGMASATITFDNSDGWLPIDFIEVAVTRRAYRDGTNEYLINGQRVRLKDVSELLAQSGLAERTYTIIGQGLVDAALALKAEDRRRLFEEAAGIGLHRSRREEALRRLETTRRNLERVEDILAELQPRLRSLERQARRTQEYELVKADLQELLREWYGYHWHRAQAELTEALTTVHAQETNLEHARQEQNGLAEKLAGLRDRSQSLRASLNSWHRQSAQLHSRSEILSRDLAVAEERWRSLRNQQVDIRDELAHIQAEASLFEERLELARQEVRRLQAELSDARSKSEEAHQAFSERLKERAIAEQELHAARQALTEVSNQQGQLQARLLERKEQARRNQRLQEALLQAREKVEKERQDAERQSQEAERIWKEADSTQKATEQALLAHRQRISHLEDVRREILEQRSSLAAEQARLQAQLNVLDQAEQALSGYTSGTRLLLQAARQARLSGARGALSSFLEVPGELEAAIAAALGEYLEAVLLDTQPETALDLLEGEAGRAVLLPLKRLKPAAPLASFSSDEEIGRLSGVIGLAADLVNAPAELQPAVDLLLGQAVIVADRDAAQLLLSTFSEPDSKQNEVLPELRAITLRGEVFHASGQVLAGSPGGGQGEKTILGRQRARRESGKQLVKVEQGVSELTDQLALLDEQLKGLLSEADQYVQAQGTALRQQEQARRAADQARLSVEQSSNKAGLQQEQIDRLKEEISRGEQEDALITTDLGRLEEEISQAHEHVRQASADLAALALDEFQAQVTHWNTLSAVAEQALENGISRQDERQHEVDRNLQAQASREGRLAEIETTLASLDNEKINRRQSEGEISVEIEALRVLIEPAEAELEKLEAEQAGFQTLENAARQALSHAEHHHAQARIMLARRQEALEGLRRRIEDDFGLVAFEYEEVVSGPTPLPLQGMVEQLPRVLNLGPDIDEAIQRQRAQLRRMGPINPEAQAEFQEVKQRFAFLTEQVADLKSAEASIRQVIAELDGRMQQEFRTTFDAVAIVFKEIFVRLFGGGSAHLVLTDPDDLTETGIDIEARLPGRRLQGLSLLSGGERSLTAVALVFALLKVSPTPFCVLDEVDAMLDEANVGRFRELLRELSQNTQFVVVTHNRNTVQVADVIYGVTMGRDSSSQVLSLKLDEVSQIVE